MNKSGILVKTLDKYGLDVDKTLLSLFTEHYSYIQVKDALEEKYGIKVLNTTIRYHAKRLGFEYRLVDKDWYAQNKHNMLNYRNEKT